MKTEVVETQSFSGPERTRVPCIGEKVTLFCAADHGDWKTALVRKDAWPTIPKGTEVVVAGWMQNMEGLHLKVRHREWVYDIPFHYFTEYLFEKRGWG